MLKEIVTKAVISKGKIIDNEEMEFSVDTSINKVIGCWIINHNYLSLVENDKVYASGCYDIHIWYAKNNSSDTGIFKKTIDYKQEFILDNDNFNKEESEYKLYCVEYPSCSSLNLIDNKFALNVKKTLAIDVIGESKLLVQVGDSKANNEDNNLGINTNYINR